MSRNPQFARLALVFGLGLGGCGSLGQSGEYSPQVLNGGTSPFRLATKQEMGFTVNPIGMMIQTTASVGRSQLVGDAVFYDGAEVLAAPPPRDTGLVGWEVDWNQYDPRSIYRSTTHTVDGDGVTRQGFVADAAALSPTLPWEAAGVFDPAIVVQPSGAVRLYYATAAGIGVAEAPTVTGTFTRLVNNPILPDVDGRGPAVSPAPVVLPTGVTMLYVEAGGAIFIASSSDGLAFTLVDTDPSTVAIDPIDLSAAVAAVDMDAGVPADAGMDAGMDASVLTEVAQRGPTALVATSLTGRTTVRMYFEVRRSDGSSVISVAGSYDGLVFERSSILSYTKNFPVHPAIYLRPDGISLLTFALPRAGGGPASAVPMLSLTPSSRPLPAP